MCTLVAANLISPTCGHRLVDCVYTTPRHATCEYASPYQPITAFTLRAGQPLENSRHADQLITNQDGGTKADQLIAIQDGGSKAEQLIARQDGRSKADQLIVRQDGGSKAEQLIARQNGGPKAS